MGLKILKVNLKITSVRRILSTRVYGTCFFRSLDDIVIEFMKYRPDRSGGSERVAIYDVHPRIIPVLHQLIHVITTQTS